ncbi:MAG: DUF1028 domain-containing protein, partial [Acidobacteriia bacterium]|nr:DUF1028 domain-containing protein [Terriglobia bacterium]
AGHQEARCSEGHAIREAKMKAVFKSLALAAALLAAPPSAFATWSIVAVDQDTGRVSMATASCVDVKTDHEYRDLTTVVVPGVGIAACQSGVDRTFANQKFIYEEMKKGTEPKAILEKLAHDDPNYQSRQFAIVDLKGRMAAHTGLDNAYVAQDFQGQVPGTRIFFSVQANIMRPGKIVPNAVQAFPEPESIGSAAEPGTAPAKASTTVKRPVVMVLRLR